MTHKHVLALDLGNESGRVVDAAFDGNRIQATTRYRFANHPVVANGTLYWDVLRLWHEIQHGIAQAAHVNPIDGLGVASFGVDFGLLDRTGGLLGNPVHMRDTRTEGALDWVFERVPARTLFERTGIGAHPINTLFQLAALVRDDHPQLQLATTLLTMPNLINYWLTGAKLAEFTHITTTQCYNPFTATWDTATLNALDIPAHIFPPIVQPGERIGSYNEIPVFTVPSHDTASAVAAVPTQTPHYAYISSGTWSLFGLEVETPVINQQAFAATLTNEGGYGGTYRMLSLIMGMWLVQECRRHWQQDGNAIAYDTLFEIDGTQPFAALINPDDPTLFTPGDMVSRIQALCQHTAQTIPQSRPQVIRCIMESLALKYDYVLRQQTAAANQPVEVIHIVGGGAQNTLLCQMTANATGIPVAAGPVEATALGNALVQLIAIGEIADLAQARAVVRTSYPVTHYQPQDADAWAAARERFAVLMG